MPASTPSRSFSRSLLQRSWWQFCRASPVHEVHIFQGHAEDPIVIDLLQTALGQVLPLLLLVHDGAMGLDLFPAGTIQGIPLEDGSTCEQQDRRHEEPCPYEAEFSPGALHDI